MCLNGNVLIILSIIISCVECATAVGESDAFNGLLCNKLWKVMQKVARNLNKIAKNMFFFLIKEKLLET